MTDIPDLSAIGALVGESARGKMLAALMDGRALTATELALEGGVSPSTASSHLTRLTDAGLLAIARQGRHRYYRIALPEVAEALEGLMGLAARSGLRAARAGPRDDGLRRARVCYDHLAGEAGVRLFQRLRERRLVGGSIDQPELTPAGDAWCARLGIDVAALRKRRRPLFRACLDWSERRTHLGGAMGAAVLDRLFALRYARRVRGRVVRLSPRGESFIERPEIA